MVEGDDGGVVVCGGGIDSLCRSSNNSCFGSVQTLCMLCGGDNQQ